MSDKIYIKPIAHIYNDYKEKFGIPRQSFIADGVVSTIRFEKEYDVADAFRELENFSHIWLIWHFSDAPYPEFSPTVRPPRLGGNKRVGVFATRSPFRPNSLGLSCVKLEKIEKTDSGTVLKVRGADLKNGTPIFDIKPYLAFSDSFPDATGGFASEKLSYSLKVEFPEKELEKIEEEKRCDIIKILENDPRPSYHTDEERTYGFCFGKYEIKFTVSDTVLKVKEVIILKEEV